MDQTKSLPPIDHYAVVIPAFNRESQLPDSLHAILTQSLPPTEICVVDDGSSDQTAAVAKAVSDKITVIQTENQGPGAARRTAIANTAAPWIFTCDSDDLWHKDFAATLHQLHQRVPTAELLFTNFRILDGAGNVLLKDKFSTAPADSPLRSSDPAAFIDLGTEYFLDHLRFQPIFMSSTGFTRALYNRVGGIETLVDRMPSEDAHLTRKMVAHSHAAAANKVCSDVIRAGDNFSASSAMNDYGAWQILRDLLQGEKLPQRFWMPTQAAIKSRAGGVFDGLFAIEHYSEMKEIWHTMPAADKTIKRRIKHMISALKR